MGPAQGDVGDCWFVSALAVVAQRPDLIAKLVEPVCARGGRYEVRLVPDSEAAPAGLNLAGHCT